MSVIYSFMDDCSYGADEINQTFSKLTTEGVSLFNYANGDNPLVDLNDAVSGFVTPGVELYNINACLVVYDEENDKFTISAGNAFMFDGSTITIDSEPVDFTEKVYELRKSSSDDIFVSFYRNIPNNSIDIIVDTDNTAFNSQYSVPLAKISSANTVLDMRKLAQTKVAPCSANVIQNVTANIGSVYYDETGYKLRREIIKDVFPGATKVYLNGVVRDIQKVNIDAGESLNYELAYHHKVSMTVEAAFNLTSEGLEVWASIPYGSSTIGSWNLLIF